MEYIHIHIKSIYIVSILKFLIEDFNINMKSLWTFMLNLQ